MMVQPSWQAGPAWSVVRVRPWSSAVGWPTWNPLAIGPATYERRCFLWRRLASIFTEEWEVAIAQLLIVQSIGVEGGPHRGAAIAGIGIADACRSSPPPTHTVPTLADVHGDVVGAAATARLKRSNSDQVRIDIGAECG